MAFSEAIGPRKRVALLCLIAVSLSSGLSVVIFLGIRAVAPGPADGVALSVIAALGALTSFCVGGPMIAFVVVVVSRLRSARLQLQLAVEAARNASASKSTFLANMSHEIRTPLNGVMGMAQLLGSTRLDASQREFVSTIQESGRVLMALLNDVLDLSKIEAGKFDILPADASISHVVRRQHQLWSARAAEKGLDFSLVLSDDLPDWSSFDKVRVQQCLSNILSNAIKFTDQGRVDMSVGAFMREDGQHMIEVRVFDTGIGMDAETLGRLFHPFAQADQTTSRSRGGTGLGLSITRRLAELMGGGVSASSVRGQGSNFTLWFLAGEAASRRTAEGAEASSGHEDVRLALASSRLRILLVDDHPINRRVASLFLAPLGAQVVEAENGVGALAALEGTPFDVVLLDMHMPVMDGPETIDRIRRSDRPWQTVPVIALTADAMSGDRERYIAMGMDGYVPKPLDERALLAEITRVAGIQPRIVPAAA